MSANRQFLIAFCFLGLSNCAANPVESRETILTDGTELPSPSRQRLWDSVLEHFTLRQNVTKDIRFYLEGILNSLYPGADSNSSFKFYFSTQKVLSIDQSCWVFPGMGAIIDLNFLKSLGGENEYAAAISFAYERARLDTFQNRLTEEINRVPGNADQIINFLTEEDIAAMDKATEILYRAGYDPRSLIGVFNNLPETPEQKMKLLKEATQQRIFKYPPIVNPVTKTTQFYKIQREVNKL